MAQVIGIVREYLTSKYGEVKPEWEIIISLLADNIELYKECRASIKEYGIYDETTAKKNPLLSTMKDLQATIMKLIQHLGLSPYAASKIKDAIDDDSIDYIDSLTKE